jgi:hypothetical protein
VHRIDFYNQNYNFYKHGAEGIVEQQSYYSRDENGYVGKTNYPFSAKLSTIELGKVAVDILEVKRNNREFYKELQLKALNIVNKDDDVSEMLYKINEQVRLMNDDLMAQIRL